MANAQPFVTNDGGLFRRLAVSALTAAANLYENVVGTRDDAHTKAWLNGHGIAPRLTRGNADIASDASVAAACHPGHEAYAAAINEMVRRFPGITAAAEKYANFWGSENEAKHRIARDLAAETMLVADSKFRESAEARLKELLTNPTDIPPQRENVQPIMTAEKYADRVLGAEKTESQVQAATAVLEAPRTQTQAPNRNATAELPAVREAAGKIVESLDVLRNRWRGATETERGAILKEVDGLVQSLGGKGITAVPLRVAARDYVRWLDRGNVLQSRAVAHVAHTQQFPTSRTQARGRSMER